MNRWIWTIAFALLCSCRAESPSAAPTSDEVANRGGMWVPSQLNTEEHAKRLEQLGLALDPALLANPLQHPLAAIVHLGNCTASFVSPDGLIITNHHCVQEALQYNSTPEDNLIRDGFLARTRAEEKWNGPGSRVYVTQTLKDVTNAVRKGLEGLKDDQERYLAVENRQKELLAQCEKDRPELRCEVAGYDGGTRYLLIERRQLNDVRLVHAPPGSVGRYGGEIDNWMWPRHTGDYSFYRAYVAPDGSAAEYSPENVPYRSEHYLRLPTEALAEGDLVFVAGYPGRTYRNYTAAEALEVTEWFYPRRIQVSEDYLAALDRAAADDEEARIRATPMRRRFENVLKYTKGALEGLVQGRTAAERKQMEEALRDKDPELFSTLDAEFQKQRETRELDTALYEFRVVGLLSAALAIVRMAEERPKADGERKPGFQARDLGRLEEAQRRLERTYSRVNDVELLTTAMGRAAENGSSEVVRELLGDNEPAPDAIRSAVSDAYAKTKLEDTATRLELLKSAQSEELAAMDDPLMRLARALRQDQTAAEERKEAHAGRMLLLRPRYLALLKAEAGREIAPDANSTLRVTYGTIRGYRKSSDAEPYTPFTTLAGMAAKATGKPPFDAPTELLVATESKNEGRYMDEGVGDVPVNFLSDLDITGGNSGSPTLNRKGEIVGLAFDGNYEAMASDWLFMPDITRCISVDIRYVLWLMENVLEAEHLVAEMRGTKSVADTSR
ncbi:MAG: S46 family peptidase [Myxococcota bacterium]